MRVSLGRKSNTKIIGLRSILLLGLFAFCLPLFLQAQNTSNKGKDFWLGYGNHVGTNKRKMSLYITSDVSTVGNVEIPGLGWSKSYSVTANSITELEIPQSAFLSAEGKFNRGIHVTAEKAIVVYAHIYDEHVSGASLILPVTALGREYYSINYKQISNEDKSSSYFFVLATEDNTEVEITPSARTSGGRAAGQMFRISLSKGEIYQVLGEATGKVNVGNNLTNYFGADLTGSTIRSVGTASEPCKRIAVFSGSGKIGIGCRPGGIGSSDNLYQQVYPVSTWGKKFIAVPLASRNYDMIRLLKSDPSAEVKLNGQPVAAASFTNNLYYDFSTQVVNVIESDKPVQVVQYAVSLSQGFNCTISMESVGDPEMILLNPVEQNIDDITVYSPGAFAIQLHYINVVMKTEAVPSFKMDDLKQEQYFKKLVGNEDYSYAQIPVPAAGVHHLQADEGFNAIAYGFGIAESYGYSAGTNLKGMNVFVEDRLSKRQVTNGCAGAELGFRIDLVYPVSRISWDFKNGQPPFVRNNLQADSTYTLNGNTYYVYKLSDDVVFADNKDYSIEIKVDKIFADGCGNSEIIPFDFSVYSSPLPAFSVAESCENDSVQFKDLSDNKGREIKKWHWDFGDGSFSEEQNPVHKYAQGGDYPVSLTVSNNTGCNPVTVSESLHINKRPRIDFEVTGTCHEESFVFTDKSVSVDGALKTWIWEMGDGTVLTKSSAASFNYAYQNPGEYTVRLSLETAKGCMESDSTRITVHPLPVADFILPEACTEDAYAEFKNTSTVSDGSAAMLTYSWNFGDPAASLSNPNTSTNKDPRHIYKIAGTYPVSLTVISAKGCIHTITKMLTINGNQPVAGFELRDPGAQCSSKPVMFVNKAYVNGFGSITKIEWYFDALNEPLQIQVDEDPYPGKEYSHQYPAFHTPANKTVSVRQVVYSGTVCVDEQLQVITLKPSTEIDFDIPEEICQEVPSIQLVAKELHGFAGTGYFSGTGISSAGLFKPSVAGAGKHTLSYTYETANGCPVSASKEINVLASPLADAGEDRTIIAFGETKLLASTNEVGASYKWSPASGLSNYAIPNPIASPLSSTTYTLTVTTPKGCSSSDEVRVDVLGAPEIPNTFTPNGDGVNETWGIKYLESLPKCRISVFNRLGNMVFESKGYANPWNGRYNNQNLPDGVYYYVLDPGNGRKPLTGSVTIVR